MKLTSTQDKVLRHIDAYMDKQDDLDELVLICAQDIVAAWPTLTMRTMGQMTKRIDTLRQALEAAK